MAVIEFWPHTANPAVASYRLRCLRVEHALRAQGVDVARFRPRGQPKVLILSKRYDPDTLRAATELRASTGTKLVLDICDNHLYLSRVDEVVAERARHLIQAIRAVDLLIASTAYLGDLIQSAVPEQRNLCVIGDFVEPPNQLTLSDILANPIAWLHWISFRKRLAILNPRGVTRFVWFGNHGNDYVPGGMFDIRKVLPHLEALHSAHPSSLTVISNSRRKFDVLSGETSLPMLYVPWSEATFSAMLMAHATCIIPISANPFTLAKTDNRVATALVHGLQVVADPIPSYQKYSERIYLDDWRTSLEKTIIQTNSSESLINSDEVNAVVSAQWSEALLSLLN